MAGNRRKIGAVISLNSAGSAPGGLWQRAGRHLRSLRALVLLWILLPIVIFLLGLSLTDIYGHQQTLRAMIEDRDGALAHTAADRIADDLQHRTHLLKALADNSAFRQAAPEVQAQMLLPLEADFPSGVVILDADGLVSAVSHGAEAWEHNPFVARLASDAVRQGAPAYRATPGDGLAALSLAIAVAWPDGTGALVGVVPLNDAAIAAAVRGLQVTPQTQAWLYDGQGQMILRANDGADVPLTPPPASEGMVILSLPVPNTQWRVIMAEPWHRMVPLVLRYAQATVLIAAAAVLISLLAIYFGLRYITYPLQQLGQQARRMAWGEFAAVQDSVGGVEEIADLQDALRQMASQVRGYQAAMHNYVAAVTQAQEDERLRLARELHDDTVQSLIALGQRLERAEKAIAQNPNSCAEHLEGLRRATRTMVQDVRRLIGDLRPIYLDDLGLVTALEMLAAASPAGHRPTLTVRGAVRRLAPDLELSLYRIVQSALKNAEQHAHAAHVSVELSFDDQAVHVIVQDDGVGFDVPDSPDELARQGHFGLLGMRERAMLFGGSLMLTSRPGHGTRVEATLPSPA